MPYSSSLFTVLGKQLRQPTWWAAIASLGFHGMLGASTPVISVFYPPQKPPGKVEVVQLTPAEMSRLPQIFPPQISPPNFNLSPIPAPPNVTPPLPPGPSDFQFPALSPGMSSSLPRSSQFPLDSPPPSNDIPATPPPNRPLSRSKSSSPQPQPKSTIPPQPQEDRLPEPPPVRSDSNGEMGSNGGSSSSNQPGAKPTAPKFWDQIAASGGIKPGSSSQSSDAIRRNFNPKPPTSPPTNQPQQPGISKESAEMLDASEKSRIAYEKMAKEYKDAYEDTETTRVITVDTPYPKAACSGELQGITVLGVFVNPQGKIAAEPKILASTNQPILDNAAVAAVKMKPFETASNHKLYLLKVDFKYDREICASPSADPSTPAPKPSPSPTPASQTPSPLPSVTPTPPSATPKPSPTPSPTLPSATPKPSPTPSPTLPSATPTPTPESSPTPTPESSVSPTPTPESSPTPTPESSVSPTPTPESSPTPTPESSGTPSPEPSASPTPETTEN